MKHPTSRNVSLLALAALAVVVGGVLGPNCDQQQTEPQANKGVALAIGLNHVSPAHYGGWSGDLTGCEPDANDMAAIATSQHLNTTKLLTQQATRQAVINQIRNAANQLNEGNLFILSYSGHGGQLPDMNGDEADNLDETWCLYDGQLIDDELHAELAKFKPGVRVLVFSDSCHSGTVVKMRPEDFTAPDTERGPHLKALKQRFDARTKDMAGGLVSREVRRARSAERRGEEHPVELVGDKEPSELIETTVRAMDPVVARNTYRENEAFYDNLGKTVPREDKVPVKAAVILIAGCEDNQYSADIGTNGLFTLMLKQVWNHGAFRGTHPAFYQQIRDRVSQALAEQRPHYFKVGITNPKFEEQRPYTIEPPKPVQQTTP